MSAADVVANAVKPQPDNVKALKAPLKKIASSYPAATQKGYKIVADKYDKAGLVRIADDESERLVSGGIWNLGLARDADSLGWCNVLVYMDQDGNRRLWLMPKGLLAGDKTEAIRELLERGLFVVSSSKAKADLFDYIAHGGNDRYITVERTGWHGDSFVLPDRVIGTGNYLLANPKPAKPSQGTLATWRESIASQCAGNTRLVLGVSAAFASPLLNVAGVEGGALHFVGTSSVGKTKVLRAASSVFGVEVSSWRTTANGLEATAAEHSDIGLLLDEIGEIDPRHAGEAIYMLGNGIGKVRARRDGSGKPASTHRLITLTTGEKSLSEHMASGGLKTMAGQEVRLINIEADTGGGMGLFENIHGSSTAQEFADCFDSLAGQHTGHAGPAFVQYIIDHREHCKSAIKETASVFSETHQINNDAGQVQRVAKRFALIAAAGELATEAGITGWQKNETIRAASACFKQWRENWTPTGSREHEKAIGQVRGFLQRHQARFMSDDNRTPHNCAGYLQRDEYWIYPSVFRDEVCNGMRPRIVTTALIDANHLTTDDDGKSACRRTADGNRQRFYVVNNSILAGDD